jgi:hypothetical protein
MRSSEVKRTLWVSRGRGMSSKTRGASNDRVRGKKSRVRRGTSQAQAVLTWRDGSGANLLYIDIQLQAGEKADIS